MDATIVDERLAGSDLALVFRGVVVVDPLHVVPSVLRIGDHVIVHQNERHRSTRPLGFRAEVRYLFMGLFIATRKNGTMGDQTEALGSFLNHDRLWVGVAPA